ncbi:Scr1 family TA system antitoxin-like transcriptional regulator [Streptomyces sp. NPDC058378]|uniref:helix-turn-helix domain-containing protein n=1 Tax=Streptomyces sp. NPDC058378 TaxID=3346469 RepID=UPI00365FBA14
MKLVGKLVGLFRVTADLTQAQLADRAAVQVETIASIEQGRRALLPDLARRLDTLLDTKGALETAVDNMPEVDLIPAWAEQYMDLEREALTLSWYETHVVPGLFQTEAYAHAVFRNRLPTFSDDEVSAQVAARLERQAILHRPNPPTVSVVVWEAALMLRLVSLADHKEQLHHLHMYASLPGVCLQILPLSTKSHAGLDGPFTLLETPDHQHLGYAETQRGSQLISDPDEVSILTQRYAMLRTQALNTEDTRSLLDQLLGDT